MKGSVRSLPPRRMHDIRQMFEREGNQSPELKESDMHEEGDSYVKATQSRFEHIDEAASSQTTRWRQHIAEPRGVGDNQLSPTRKPRQNKSPSRLNESPSGFPVPSPRRSLRKKDSVEGDSEPGLSDLPIAKFGGIAGVVADMADDRDGGRVSRLIGQYKGNDSEAKPYADSAADSSPSKTPMPVPVLTNRRAKSPVKSKLSNNETVQSRLHTRFAEPRAASCNLSVPSHEDEKRPVSVSERSRLFEKISGSPASSSPSQKPAKPPPPSRQRSFDSSDQKPTGEKIPPKRPPMRQRSLVEKENVPVADSNSNATNEDTKTPAKVPMRPPAPPSKPQRTFAHDDYIKVKFEKQTDADKMMSQSAHADLAPEMDEEADTVVVPAPSGVRKLTRPLRPPPPKKKQRPFSIATDNIMDLRSSDGSDSDTSKKSDLHIDNMFYEVVPMKNSGAPNKGDEIKHWDLPRMSHPEPIRRSLSDDCIHKAVDNEVDAARTWRALTRPGNWHIRHPGATDEIGVHVFHLWEFKENSNVVNGNVVYMDPDTLGIHGNNGYDIYVDTEGYAVPNRLVKRNKSTTDEEMESSRPIGDRVKSKFRRFKNLFSEQEKSPSSSSSSSSTQPKGPPDKGSQKKRLDAIKQKVSQAFEVLGARLHKDSETPEEESEDETTDPITDDAGSRVDERARRKRVEYSRSVRIKTSKSIREARIYTQKIYPQLFEHAMIVGLQLSDAGEYEPYVKYKFPEIKDSNVSIPLFCFPDAANYKPSSSSSKSQAYHFVLTNFDGGRVYGYCRRLVPPSSKNKMPEVICIISPVDAFSMYNSLLEEIEKKRLQSQDAAQELIAASFGRPLPAPGMTETIRTLDESGEMETFFLNRETDNRIDNVNCECVLTTLGSDKFLKVFASILLERSVLFCSKHLGTLSSTIHAITSLLYPFSWQHTFIPVLPAAMIDVVCSPTPYIIGITSTLTAKALSLPLDENVLVVDLDKRSFQKSQGDEGTLLPSKVEKALKTSLNMCRVDSEAKSSPNLMISEAFVRFFVEAVGHYGNYLITKDSGKKHFQKDEFLKDPNSQPMEDLLEWFVETQMFEVFITTQIEKKEWGNTIEFFQSRVQEYKAIHGRNMRRRPAKKIS